MVPRSETGFAMRRKMLSRAAVAAILIVLVLAGCGQERTIKTVRITTDNGATIIVRENRASGVVAAQLFVRDGTLFETADEAGTVNLLRSQMFHETESRGPGEIMATVEGLGGIMSSSGRHDFVQYALAVPSGNFIEAFDLIRDGLVNAKFDPEKVVRDREEVRANSERSSSSSGSIDRAYRLCLSEMMGDHPYGRIESGIPEVIGSLTAEDLDRRYREMYVGSNLLIAVSGDVDAEAASRQIADMLTELETGVQAEAVAPPVTWPTESRVVVEHAPVRRATQVVAFPGPGVMDRDNVTMDVLLVVLAEGGSSRLTLRLKEELGLVYSVGAGWYTQRHPSPFFVWMELPDENIAAAEAATVELMREIASEPVSDEELAKAKMQLKVGNIRMVETAQGQAFHDGYWNAIGGEAFASEYLERLGAVTKDEIQQAAALYLGSGVHIAAAVLPE